MPIAAELLQKWDAWVKGGVLCSEMEAATLFVVGSYRKLRTGASTISSWRSSTTRVVNKRRI